MPQGCGGRGQRDPDVLPAQKGRGAGRVPDDEPRLSCLVPPHWGPAGQTGPGVLHVRPDHQGREQEGQGVLPVQHRRRRDAQGSLGGRQQNLDQWGVHVQPLRGSQGRWVLHVTRPDQRPAHRTHPLQRGHERDSRLPRPAHPGAGWQEALLRGVRRWRCQHPDRVQGPRGGQGGGQNGDPLRHGQRHRRQDGGGCEIDSAGLVVSQRGQLRRDQFHRHCRSHQERIGGYNSRTRRRSTAGFVGGRTGGGDGGVFQVGQ
mmetsp:Transcript_34767/g.82415  ORF Transcript_34767/g.82415 Transcript_34767/m.82415 type:complete len:259 (+) Transcript_34767:200-976(+)